MRSEDFCGRRPCQQCAMACTCRLDGIVIYSIHRTSAFLPKACGSENSSFASCTACLEVAVSGIAVQRENRIHGPLRATTSHPSDQKLLITETLKMKLVNYITFAETKSIEQSLPQSGVFVIRRWSRKCMKDSAGCILVQGSWHMIVQWSLHHTVPALYDSLRFTTEFLLTDQSLTVCS